MKTKLPVWITMLFFTIVFLSGCQVVPGTEQAVAAKPATSSPLLATVPTATVKPTPTKQPTITVPIAEQKQDDEAANTAQAYFTAVSEGKSDEATKMLSSFSLTVFQITRGDAAEALQAQKIAGKRWTDLEIIDTQTFDAQTVLVHVTYTETNITAPVSTAISATTPASTSQADVTETVNALWPMRLEQDEWRYNWNNVIDFRTLDADAQTLNGITILPTQLIRYSDCIELSLLIQNRTYETVVFGQTNETLGTFYFDDQTVIAEKTQWILNPLRSVPEATLEIKGLFTRLPDMVEIRKWNNYDVRPWFIFQLQ